MADKKDIPEKDKKAAKAAPPAAKAPVRKRIFRSLLKVSLLLLVLLMLAGATLAAAIYMKFLDADALAAKYNLASYPLIGRYFAKPAATNFEPVDLPPEDPAAQKPAEAPPQAAPVPAPAPAPVPAAATPEEIKANLAKAKQEEAKRLSRLARLYGEMKPDEAAPILNQLDDPTVVAILGKMEDGQAAKIMSLLDARRAARLSQSMLKGQTM